MRKPLLVALVAIVCIIIILVSLLHGTGILSASTIKVQSSQGAALEDYVVLPVDSPSSLITGNIMTQKGAPTGSLIYEGLVTKGRTGDYTGWLADSWESSGDGSIWTFHLVRNARWHDGVPFTSEDVKFTHDYMKANNLPMAFVLSDVESVECPDQFTAVFRLSHPYPVFPDRLAQSPGIGVYPAHIFKDVSDPASWVDPDPIGTGPFMFQDREPGLFRMQANPSYHGEGSEIAGVILKVVSGIDNQVLALKKGDIDAVSSLPAAVGMSLANEENIKVYTIPDTTGYELAFNTQVYPADNPLFRKAISHAVDRDRISTLLGYARPNPTTFLIPGVAGDFVNPDITGLYGYNIPLAEELLHDAGFGKDASGSLIGPDGKAVELTMPLGGKGAIGGADEKIVTIFREDLARLGIGLKTVAYDNEKEYRKAMSTAPVFIDAMPSGLHDDPDDLVNFAYTPLGDENYYRYHNPGYDALAQDVRNTTDRESRKETGYLMQEILARDIPTVPICSTDTVAAYRTDRFRGWEEAVDANGVVDMRVLTVIRPVDASS
jgi:peptide/nickel transport system substrate-binding protein